MNDTVTQEKPAAKTSRATAKATKPETAKVMERKARKILALIASEKGGVGKSVFTRALIDWLRSNGVRVACYDADGSVGSTLATLGTRDASGAIIQPQNPVEGCGFYSGRDNVERDVLLNSTESGEGLIVHDLAGGMLQNVTQIIEGGLPGLAGLLDMIDAQGYDLVVFHMISPVRAAAASVSRWLQLTDERVKHVAVVNRAWSVGDVEKDFPYWYGFQTAAGVQQGGNTRSALLSSGGLEIEFPSLRTGIFAKLDAENIPFSKADGAGILTLAERGNVAAFRKAFGQSIAPVLPLLGVSL